ncbi:MAG: RICIN domain-containing protein [Holophagales bacterium]|nr:RICIN domain-containing protein [Holophagales bacterium]
MKKSTIKHAITTSFFFLLASISASVSAVTFSINESTALSVSVCEGSLVRHTGEHPMIQGTFDYRWDLLHNNVSILNSTQEITCDPGIYCGSATYGAYTPAWPAWEGVYRLRLRILDNNGVAVENHLSNAIVVVVTGVPTAISKINGSSQTVVPVDVLTPIRLDGSGSICADSYFVSIQLSDASWGRHGHEAHAWLDASLLHQYGPISNFDIRRFAEDRWMGFGPGQYYRVKLGISPWHSTTKLIKILPTSLSAVRLRHKATGKCIYEHGGNGGQARNWGCWDDPYMAYVIDDLGNGDVRLRHSLSGKCLYGYSIGNGGTAHHWDCWNDPGFTFVLDPVGNGEVRLRHKSTGKCLYGTALDGGTVHNWVCWNDPGMVYVLEGY